MSQCKITERNLLCFNWNSCKLVLDQHLSLTNTIWLTDWEIERCQIVYGRGKESTSLLIP